MMQVAPIPLAPTEPYTDVVKQPLLDHKRIESESQQIPLPNVLEDLTSVDRLTITKQLQVKSALFFRGKKNRYFIKTPDQNLVYSVEEENRWWVGYFFCGLRPLQLRVRNGSGTEVLRIERAFSCTSRALPCQLQRLLVRTGDTLIGTVDQRWTAIRPVYIVRRDNGEQVFWIRGPRVTLSCFRDVQFQITRPDGRPVGSTYKRWQGLTHALFFAPVIDKFGVAFERDLSVVEKALLLAATLLLDYMYFDV